MAIPMAFGVAALACLAACLVDPTASQVFDVTDFGAIADGKTENSKAFMDAWRASCAYQGSATYVVPPGTYLLGPVVFTGPCTANKATTVSINGTLKALPDLAAFSKFGWIEFNQLHELVVRGGGTLDGQGADAWKKTTCPNQRKCKNLPTSLRFNQVNNGTISDLHLVDSKGFHMNFHQCANIVVTNLNITAPADSPNTDGIHVAGTHNINITHTNIGTGDDCISVGPGTTNIHIAGVRCGPGHGISVGSLGKYPNEMDVSGVTVKNCTLSGTTNGVRVKTWPGAPASRASNFTFEDIVVDEVANPIIIDQEYCPVHHCDKTPSRVKIAGVTFRRVRGTSKTPVAVHLVCSEAAPCDNVRLEDIELKYDGSGSDDSSGSTCSHVMATFLGAQEPPPCKI